MCLQCAVNIARFHSDKEAPWFKFQFLKLQNKLKTQSLNDFLSRLTKYGFEKVPNMKFCCDCMKDVTFSSRLARNSNRLFMQRPKPYWNLLTFIEVYPTCFMGVFLLMCLLCAVIMALFHSDNEVPWFMFEFRTLQKLSKV